MNITYIKIDCGVLCVNCSLVSSSIRGTTSRILDQDNMTNFYNLQVVCDIRPSSAADYCEVFAYGPDTITGRDLFMPIMIYRLTFASYTIYCMYKICTNDSF